MSTEASSGDERRDPRAMLAMITLAVDLPLPKTIDLYPSGILGMTFERLVDGLAWALHLGGHLETYVYQGRRYLREGLLVWEGWHVQLFAAEDVPAGEPLPADTTTALNAVARD